MGHAYLAADAQVTCLGIAQALHATNDFALAANVLAPEPEGDVDSASVEEMDPAAAVQPEPEIEAQQPDTASTDATSGAAQASGCEFARQHRGSDAATVNISNVGPAAIEVYLINDQGGESDYQYAPEPLVVLLPGQAESIDA